MRRSLFSSRLIESLPIPSVGEKRAHRSQRTTATNRVRSRNATESRIAAHAISISMDHLLSRPGAICALPRAPAIKPRRRRLFLLCSVYRRSYSPDKRASAETGSDGGASTGPAYPYLYGSDGRRLRRSCAAAADAAEVSSRARQVRATADRYLTFYQYIVRFYEGPAARVIVYAPTALYIGPRPRMQSKEFTRDLFVSRASLFNWFLFGSMWHSQLRHVCMPLSVSWHLCPR